MSRRNAFTLVELLVVAGIFAMLFGMVLNGARPSASGQVKQAAQSIASVLLATQSKALGKPAGAGIILTGTSGFSATSVSAADMLPLITGACTNGMPPALTATSGTVAITPDNADPRDARDGFKIRFQEWSTGTAPVAVQPPTPWLGFEYVSNSGSSAFQANVFFRINDGQTDKNTIWPKPVKPNNFSVTIARYPSRAETAYELPRAAAIDLRCSGIGDGPSSDSNWLTLSNKGAIGITFDSVGRVDNLMQKALPSDGDRLVQPLAPVQPIYLLVAERATVESGTINPLASNSSIWVAIHPQTGRVSVSSNVVQTGTFSTNPAVLGPMLREARRNARAGLAIGK
jgi:type II secretory pathway pseudopilin PulG